MEIWVADGGQLWSFPHANGLWEVGDGKEAAG